MVCRDGWEGDAIIEVTLLNNEHGFKFEEYGASITVRRTIKQPSGGGFQLLDHAGKVRISCHDLVPANRHRCRRDLHHHLSCFCFEHPCPCGTLCLFVVGPWLFCQVKSRDKAELVRMLDELNIQVRSNIGPCTSFFLALEQPDPIGVSPTSR